jgi:hypothetical protein
MKRIAERFIRCRYFLIALSVFTFADPAHAQRPNTYRIGFLSPASAASMDARVGRFRQGLRELGYVEGTQRLSIVGPMARRDN